MLHAIWESLVRNGTLGPVITWRDHGTKDIKTAFMAAARRVHIKGISPHVLRHTAASWLMQAGHDPWKVSDFLSMSLATLLKVYGHHHPDSQSEIARLRPPSAECPENALMFSS